MDVEMTYDGLYVNGRKVTSDQLQALLEGAGYTVTNSISSIVSPDAPVTVNEKGGAQSDVPVRFDLIDAKAMFEMAKVLDHGAKKYGANNWRSIPVDDHLNHLLMHTFAHLAGDRTDDHLSHILCRATFALGVTLQGACDASIGNPMVGCVLPLGHDTDHKFPEITGDY